MGQICVRETHTLEEEKDLSRLHAAHTKPVLQIVDEGSQQTVVEGSSGTETTIDISAVSQASRQFYEVGVLIQNNDVPVLPAVGMSFSDASSLALSRSMQRIRRVSFVEEVEISEDATSTDGEGDSNPNIASNPFAGLPDESSNDACQQEDEFLIPCFSESGDSSGRQSCQMRRSAAPLTDITVPFAAQHAFSRKGVTAHGM